MTPDDRAALDRQLKMFKRMARRINWIGVVFFLAVNIAWIGLLVTAIYVAIHFVRKWW